jgi:CheY-like chemotaxis protein
MGQTLRRNGLDEKQRGQAMISEQLVILMAEDDDGHANLVQRNLQRSGVVNRIYRVTDGQEALEFIECTGAHSNRKTNGPLLLLLDINMPRIDGVEVLRRLKASEKHCNIPVIMLTTTDDPREVQRCYELGCSVYITKPVSYEEFVEAVTRLGMFLSIVQVPREDDRK